MARTPLRPDIAAAQSRARIRVGIRRELSCLQGTLAAEETVSVMFMCRYRGWVGLAVLTDARLLVIADGMIWKMRDEVPLDRVSFVQWQTVFGVGALTVHAGGSSLEFTGIQGPAGQEAADTIREHLAGQDQLERQCRAGILALAANFAPNPAPVDDPEDFFLAADQGSVTVPAPRAW